MTMTLDQSTDSALTPREMEIAALVALEYLTNQEIAGRLCITVKAVDFHMQSIRNKLELPNRVAVCAWWYKVQEGLISQKN